MKKKKITSRQKKIILMIVENSKKNIPITISEIAGMLELSSRTVLRDMSGIEKWFDENDFNFSKKTRSRIDFRGKYRKSKIL